MKNNFKESKGFTLLELLVVIAVIALLASIILVSLQAARGKARYGKMMQDMSTIVKAAEMYKNAMDVYPGPTAPPNTGVFVPDYLTAWPSSPCQGWYYVWFSLGLNAAAYLADGAGQPRYCYLVSGNCTGGSIKVNDAPTGNLTCQ